MEPTLLLNASYEPLSVVTWKKAITLLLLGKAEMIETQEYSARSVSKSYALPAVLRLRNRVTVPRKSVGFTRANVYRRDGFRCQYCTEKFSGGVLTFDHVMPVSRGGRMSWENIVTSCGPCNRAKGDLTPEEASMPLLKQPKAPRWRPFSLSSWDAEDHPLVWHPYMWM